MMERRNLVLHTGPYSREGAIAKPRRRTREARFLNKMRDDLTAFVGSPSITQRLMIERIAMTLLRIELMDAGALKDADGSLTERQARDYLAWNNTVARMLTRLGPGAAVTPPSLAEVIAAGRTAAA